MFEVSWHPIFVRPVRGPDKSIRVIVSVKNDYVTTSLVHIRLAQGGATMKMQRVPFGLANPQAAWIGQYGLLSYIAADQSATHDRNSLFVRRWSPETESWEDPRIVSASGNRPAYNPQLVATRDGAIHLVWAQADSLGQIRSLRHIESHDRGQRWSNAVDLPVPGVVPRTAFPVGDDAVGIVYVTGGVTETPALMLACWRNGWRVPRAMAGTIALTSPSSIFGRTDAMVAVQAEGLPPALRLFNALVEVP
jgi:hypothetical protein